MGICTSETQEDVKVLELVGERGRWWCRWASFSSHKSHWEGFLADCCKDLKGGESKLWRDCQYNTRNQVNDKLGRGWIEGRGLFKGSLLRVWIVTLWTLEPYWSKFPCET